MKQTDGTPGGHRAPRVVIAAGWITIGIAGLIAESSFRNGELGGGRLVIVAAFALLGLGLIRASKAAYWIAGVGVGLFTALGALSLLDEMSAGRVIGTVIFATVPALLFLSPSARAWGNLSQPDAGAASADGVGSSDPLPRVDGWHRPRLGGRLQFWFLVLVGVLMLLGGIAMALGSDDDRGPGVTVAFFGLGLVVVTPLFRTWSRAGRPTMRTIDIHGRTQAGLSFPYSPYKSRATALAALCMGAACAGFALFADSFADPGESPTLYRLVGGVGGLFFIGGGLVLLRKKAGEAWHVTLLPDGVAAVAGGTRSFVPWDAIASVDAFDFTFYTRGFANHEPYIGISATDRDRIEASKMGRMLMRTNRFFGTDLAYPVRALDVDPTLAYHALRYYHRHPDARAELSGEAAVRRVEERRL